MKYQIYRPYDTKRTEFKLKESIEMSRFIRILIKQHLVYAMDDMVKHGLSGL